MAEGGPWLGSCPSSSFSLPMLPSCYKLALPAVYTPIMRLVRPWPQDSRTSQPRTGPQHILPLASFFLRNFVTGTKTVTNTLSFVNTKMLTGYNCLLPTKPKWGTADCWRSLADRLNCDDYRPSPTRQLYD